MRHSEAQDARPSNDQIARVHAYPSQQSKSPHQVLIGDDQNRYNEPRVDVGQDDLTDLAQANQRSKHDSPFRGNAGFRHCIFRKIR